MKKIIFDMGNTLIDFHTGKYTDDEKDRIGLAKLSKYLWEEHNISVTPDELNKHFLLKWLGDFYLREKLVELDFMKYLKEGLADLGYSLVNYDFLELMRCYYTQYMKDAVLNKNAEECLKQLKENGYVIHVLSNCILSEEIYIEVFRDLGITQYIDKFTFSYNAGLRKPHMKLFENEVSELDLEKDEAYFVGDNLKVDIIPAVKVGMRGIWYNSQNKKREMEIECIELNDLIKILEVLAIRTFV